MYRTVLLPTDGSPDAMRAVRYAVDPVRTCGATLHALYVTDAGVEVVCANVEGAPVEAILDYADERGIDVVVMGTHGRSGLERYLLGSVTEQVVRTAPMPVLTVPPGEGESESDGERAPVGNRSRTRLTASVANRGRGRP